MRIYNLTTATKALLVLGVALSSLACSSDELGEVMPSNAINFTAEIESQFSTRASLTEATIDDIGVLAYSSKRGVDEIFNNEKLTKSDDYYIYSSSIKYYITDEKINYLAYSPYSETATVTIDDVTNSIYFDYSLANGYAEDDMLLARTTAVNQSTVALEFSHALSAVGFAVKGDANYKVKSLSLCRVYNKASAVLDSDGNITWTNHSFSIDESDITTEFPVTLADDTTPHSDGVTEKSIIDDDGYIMMIPQTTRADSYLKVELAPSDDSIVAEPATYTHYVLLNDYPELKMGCYHICTININTDYLSLTTTVEE